MLGQAAEGVHAIHEFPLTTERLVVFSAISVLSEAGSSTSKWSALHDRLRNAAALIFFASLFLTSVRFSISRDWRAAERERVSDAVDSERRRESQ